MSREFNLFDSEIETVPQGTYVQTAIPGILDKISSEETLKKQETHARFQVKRIIEALLFASSDPLTFDKISRSRVNEGMITTVRGASLSGNTFSYCSRKRF